MSIYSDFDLLVVGSGFFGATMARLAADSGFRPLVIDRRDHFGGNSYSYADSDTGIEVHQYGSHLFHTSNQRVWDFVNRFGEFNSYRHHVYAIHRGNFYSMPVNLHTVSQFYGMVLSPIEAEARLKQDMPDSSLRTIDNLEEKAISSIGRPLYEAFVRNYTIKQWGRDPAELPASTISRLPVRWNFNSRYFSDTWEGLPKEGYGELFRKLLEHPLIHLHTKTDFFQIRETLPKNLPIVYTGPIDEFFDYRFGKLGWRTLDFTFEKLPLEDFQGNSVINYVDGDVPYTRIHEFKHLHPERKTKPGFTIIAYEKSREAKSKDEPYYPINTDIDRKMLMEYRGLADKEDMTIFGGRLGTYQYLDMHMAIASAISKFESELMPLLLQCQHEKSSSEK